MYLDPLPIANYRTGFTGCFAAWNTKNTGRRKGRSRLGRTYTVAPPLDFTSLTFDDLMAIFQQPSEFTFFGYYPIPSYFGQVKLSRRGPIVSSE